MVDPKTKIKQFSNRLVSNTDSKTLNKIASANPSISEDIRKLDEILKSCAPEIPLPAAAISVVPEIIDPTQKLIAPAIIDIPAGAGTIVLEKPVFPPPKITPGISNINISPKGQGSIREALIRKQIDKNIKLNNKLPKKLSKEELKDRKIIDLFDKNFINTFSITLQKNRLLSKNILSVNDDIYRLDIQQYLNDVRPDKNINFLPDNLRGRTGGYWTLNEEKNNLIYINQYEDFFVKKPLQFLFLPIENENSASAFGRTKQSIAIRGKKNDFLTRDKIFSSALYKKYIEGGFYTGDTKDNERSTIGFIPTINRNITFFDYAHEYCVPYTKKELENLSIILKPLLADTQSDYRFYIRNFEDISYNDSLSELIMPNMYVFLSQLFDQSPNPEFKDFIQLDGLIINNTNIVNSNKNIENSSEYFDVYSQNISKLDLKVYNKFTSKFKNLIFPAEKLSLLKDFLNNKEVFPMSLNLEFSTDNTTIFTEILKNSNFSNLFLIKMIESVISNKFIIAPFDNSIQTVLSDSLTKNDSVVKNQKIISSFSRTNKRYIELETLIKNMFEDTPDLSNNFVYFGNYSADYLKTFNNSYKFYKNLMNIIFSAKLQEFVKNNFRTYQEMIGGNLAYSETLMYRIAKYEGSLSDQQITNAEPIQNIYFANSNTIDIVNFVDTQIKYNKDYTYVVYAYNLVLGNKYLYSELDNSLAPDISTLTVYQEPAPVVIEEEYYKATKKVFDFPPVFPDVQFIPFKGIDNKIRININSNVGTYNLKPIVINESDKKMFEEATKNQELVFGDPIKFRSDDQAAKFEIYRTDFQPESYADFANNLLTIINTDISSESAQSATAASYIDDIEPNKKYYYIIRAIDVHGNLSNPTELIELQIINENGTIFMIKKPSTFAEKKKDLVKSLKRFIEIKPNFMQSSINEEKSRLIDTQSAKDIKNKLILGKTDQSLWGKTFIMKVTSRSTGKKIDFKFKFEYEEVKE